MPGIVQPIRNPRILSTRNVTGTMAEVCGENCAGFCASAFSVCSHISDVSKAGKALKPAETLEKRWLGD